MYFQNNKEEIFMSETTEKITKEGRIYQYILSVPEVTVRQVIQHFPDIYKSTVCGSIRYLYQKGKLHRIGHGRYTAQEIDAKTEFLHSYKRMILTYIENREECTVKEVVGYFADQIREGTVRKTITMLKEEGKILRNKKAIFAIPQQHLRDEKYRKIHKYILSKSEITRKELLLQFPEISSRTIDEVTRFLRERGILTTLQNGKYMVILK